MSDEVHSTVELAEKKHELGFLLDTSYPMLQQLKEKCPGTHKHSQSVASIVEGVSMALDLDVTFMRVCATYHDIGKTVNPRIFTENQLDGENPHSALEPWISAQLITRHISDSAVILLSDPNFPREVIEVITQHHGNEVQRYFYDRATEEFKDKPELFRYPCPKPKTIESAVLMICDHIEATSRSKIQSGEYDPTTIIDTTINGLLDRSQLDDVSMKLGNLKKIKIALAKELEGLYQKRVRYEVDEENE